uniref:G-protein coupled receptors family 1 profile domain-containing protein n=1 Tax=Amphiprion percula TaxID=161767 RepID=A0A3P8TMM5_AMPPE
MLETRNLTDCSSGENLTEPPLDMAGCLFLSILPYGQAVPALVCGFVLFTLFSFLANLLTLLAVWWSEELSWQPRFSLVKNLILSDLMQITTFGPAVIHSLVQRRTMPFRTWCYVQYFTGSTSIFTSLLTITCMALERYLFVCRAIHYLVILTEACLRRVLTLIWIFSIAIGVVTIALLHTGGAQSSGSVTMGLLCEPDMMEQHMGFPRSSAIFRKVVGTVTLLLCLMVFFFSYCRMYQDARNAVIPFNADNNKARKTVLLDCGMFLMQLLPLLLKPAPTATAAVLHVSLLMMLMVPPCINPMQYGLRNAEVQCSPWSTCRRSAAA